MGTRLPLNTVTLLPLLLGTLPAQAKLFEYDVPGPALAVYPFNVTGQLLGDVDGDGDVDMLLVMSNIKGQQEIHLVRNDGGGSFTSSAILMTSAANDSIACKLVDLDYDRDLDLMVYSAFAKAVVPFENDGKGGFTVSSRFSLPGLGVFADLDRDGDLDMIGSYNFYWNNGIGQFTRRDAIPRRSTRWALAVSVADFDNDGWPDIFFGSWSSQYPQDEIWVSDRKGGYSLWWTGISEFPQVSFAGDLDGDGRIDLVTSGGAPRTMRVLKNFGTKMTEIGKYPVIDIVQAVRDIDGDGDPDAICLLQILLNDGKGGFNDATTALVQPPPTGGGWVWGAQLADVDGDGDPDICGLFQSSAGHRPYHPLVIRNLRRQLRSPESAGLGKSLPVTLIADHQHQVHLGISLGETRIPLPGWGDLRLDTTQFLLLPPVTLANRIPGGFTLPVPNDSTLPGLTLRFQALDVSPSPSTDVRLTGLSRTKIVQ